MLLATVNEATMVPFVSTQLNNLDLALSLAKRGNLPGAEGLIGQQFEKLFASGLYKEAAEAAADSPQVRGSSAAAAVRSQGLAGNSVWDAPMWLVVRIDCLPPRPSVAMQHVTAWACCSARASSTHANATL